MSEQALDLRRSLRIVWRHKIIVGIITALGISAGIAFTILRPPLLTSQALVALPTSKYIGTKVFVAGSNPVLINAGRRLDPPLSLQELRGRVRSRTRLQPSSRLTLRARPLPRQRESRTRSLAATSLTSGPRTAQVCRRWRRCCSPQRLQLERHCAVVLSSMEGSAR